MGHSPTWSTGILLAVREAETLRDSKRGRSQSLGAPFVCARVKQGTPSKLVERRVDVERNSCRENRRNGQCVRNISCTSPGPLLPSRARHRTYRIWYGFTKADTVRYGYGTAVYGVYGRTDHETSAAHRHNLPHVERGLYVRHSFKTITAMVWGPC